ncbi:MAG: ABC transporter substrate-binding protein, partial [Lachnospiraceae bacterium]|nr:ABC transporter substrate-binding protein [Lachnospiraceae bacterium]
NELKALESVMNKEKTGVRVAFFNVTSSGLITIRKSGDYISKMIELSGGEYVGVDEPDGETKLSTMNVTMEDFYAAAVDSDILIYNSTITGEITSIDELIEKNSMFADFKAVREKRVYCMDRSLFQQTGGMGDFMKDLNNIFNGVETKYTYLSKLD